MEGTRTVLLVVVISLSVSLLAVPSVSLYYYGCHAGTKGLFEWLPRPWSTSSPGSHPCEAGQVLRNGYQALCPQSNKDALEELLDSIGFFGTRESQELALCKLGKSFWKSLSSMLSGAYDTSHSLHQTVTKSLSENSISLAKAMEAMTTTLRYGMDTIREWVGKVKKQVIEPVVSIPYHIKQQYSEFREMYQTIRDMQQKWTNPFSFFNKHFTPNDDDQARVSSGYLASAMGYLTQNHVSQAPGDLRTDQSSPSLSDVRDGRVKGVAEDHVEHTMKPGYMAQIIHFVTDREQDISPDAFDDISGDSDRSEVKEVTLATQRLPETSSNPVLSEDRQTFSVRGTHRLSHKDVLGSKALKKVLFEALVATVTAFTIFIIGVIVYRLRRTRMLGLYFPSLRQVLVSKYIPIKGIGSSESFYKFHMVSKKTRENVFVKYLRGKTASLIISSFDNEQRCLKTINHSNIIPMRESIRVGTRLCLVLEYAEYGNLKIAMEKPVKPLGFYEKIHIYRQIIEAVHWMHKLGWGHLNIRPESILVFEMWYLVKLSGFTKAVELHYGKHCNSYSLHPMCSPPHVMARQAYNQAKADIWALGTLLFYLFTRRSIHTYAEAVRVARVVSRTDFYENSKCGLNLVRILSDLLSFDPNNRPEIRELIQTIDNF